MKLSTVLTKKYSDVFPLHATHTQHKYQTSSARCVPWALVLFSPAPWCLGRSSGLWKLFSLRFCREQAVLILKSSRASYALPGILKELGRSLGGWDLEVVDGYFRHRSIDTPTIGGLKIGIAQPFCEFWPCFPPIHTVSWFVDVPRLRRNLNFTAGWFSGTTLAKKADGNLIQQLMTLTNSWTNCSNTLGFLTFATENLWLSHPQFWKLQIEV